MSAVTLLQEDTPTAVTTQARLTPITPLQAGNGMSLRGKRDAHPAAPDMPAPWRTSDQVQAKQVQKAATKAATVAARSEAIFNTAQLEDQMQREDINTAETANQPLPSGHKKKIREKISSSVKDQPQGPHVQSLKDHSKGSDGDDETLEFDIEDGLDDSDNEGRPPTKKPKIQKKKKGELRASVGGKRSEHPGVSEHEKVDDSEPHCKKPKISLQGLRLGWKTGDSTPSKPVSHRDTLDLEADTSAEFNVGGFGDEDAGSEQSRMIGNSVKPFKIKSIAAVVKTPSILRVEPTTSVLELVTPGKRRKDIHLRDLPKEVQEAFMSIFVPIIIEFCGCIEAWTSPTVSDIQELWESTMPDGIHDQFLKLNRGKVVEALVQDKLTTWRNNTGKAALKTLKGIFIKEKLNSVDQCKTYVARQLTGTYKSYHYYHSVAVGEGSNIQYAGAFQSPLISKTFAEHLKAIESIPRLNA
ncbi:hypothetical protein F5050DRAFT_1712881 [Lentinula boryana]|uniref:Uncharacterized protein n=1 Tax=Lentinula boryana TaxID=40481 RepID=A0ABQ8QAG7_9AGAR|nr:hypothetical protein F5050DRAFT_1712881 [Lentinula boryana]